MMYKNPKESIIIYYPRNNLLFRDHSIHLPTYTNVIKLSIINMIVYDIYNQY